MNVKTIATNKKAYHDFFIEDTLEAGISLVGTEVKSVRLGAISLKESFAIIKDNSVFLINAHISPYKMGSYYNVDPKRMRRLLLNRSEINKLKGKVEKKGYTLVPTKVYLKGALVKVELGVCRGKEAHDKRDSIKEKEQLREIDRAVSNY